MSNIPIISMVSGLESSQLLPEHGTDSNHSDSDGFVTHFPHQQSDSSTENVDIDKTFLKVHTYTYFTKCRTLPHFLEFIIENR